MKDFIGFRFGNVHTKDLNLVVVTSGDRYEKNLLPNPKDYTVEISGGDGQYYFGQTFDSKEFNCDVAFDSVDEATWRKISQLFATDKLQDLVFDELPYKTYRAKLKSKPEFKFICFTDRDTGERIYKGEGTLNFICYFPYAFGFNKYIVRAADYYLNTPPETIIKTHSKAEHEYAKNLIEPLDKHTKDFYNVENNMNTPWKGGYPTFEQVQAGELFFNTPDGEKSIIDVRGYWENVPEWAPSSKLLTTPTLDYDQELIYLPQYCKINYMNMDTGLNNDNALIGSRLLVYNPGDLPVDFKLKLNNNKRSFWNGRGNHFQIRRFNVDRLTIPQAVDWTGLKTYLPNDEKKYKYGNKYFKLPGYKEITIEGIKIKVSTNYDLKNNHPNHAYIAQPIPQEKLGYFIRIFYWQSSQKDRNFTFEFNEGEEMAARYEELYELCNSEVERQELYWKTLKELITKGYQFQKIFEEDDYTLEELFYDYIHNPPEYIQTNKNLNYNEFDFNSLSLPKYHTFDYLEIKTEGILEKEENNILYVDSEKQMLYNLNKNNSFYDFHTQKNIYNENIIKGKWFKIPPGWSLIEISPVCEEDDWGGKTWNDARAFEWGYGGDLRTNVKPIQTLFDVIYYNAAKEYLVSSGRFKNEQELNNAFENFKESYEEFYKLLDNSTSEQIVLWEKNCWKAFLDSQIGFRSWFLDKIEKYQNPITLLINDKFAYSVYKRKEQQAEYGFLKLLHQYWRINKGATTLEGQEVCTGSIHEWWWYACNYIWENFPPLYWGFADILNDAKIDYIPLFY